jgi:thioredoxin-related protein
MPHLRTFGLGLSLVFGGACLATGAIARAEDPAGDAAKEEAAEKEAAAKVEAAWVKVWDTAKAKAKLEKKDLLIDFTGSDWCPPCKAMHKEVFSQVEFVEAATKTFVLVYMDFPRGEEHKKLVVDAASNERVREAYGVTSFPTVILATSDGMPYVRTGGYQEGGPSAYLKTLEEFKASRDTFQTLQSKGKTDLVAFRAGFELLEKGEFLSFPDYAWMLDHAEKQDADGTKGLKKIAEGERARQRSAVEEKALIKIANEATDDTRWAKIHEFLKTSKDLRGRMLWMASRKVFEWLLAEKDFAEARRMAELPLRDPDIAGNPQAKEAIAEAIQEVDDAEKAAAQAEAKPTEPKPEEPQPGPTPK